MSIELNQLITEFQIKKKMLPVTMKVLTQLLLHESMPMQPIILKAIVCKS